MVRNPKPFPQFQSQNSENIKQTANKNHCKFKQTKGIIFRRETNRYSVEA